MRGSMGGMSLTGARWLPIVPIQLPVAGTAIAWLAAPVRRSDAGRLCTAIAFTTLGIRATAPVLKFEIAGMCSQLRRLLCSNPLATIAFERPAGVHAATTTGRVILLVAIACRNPLLATAILFFAVVVASADFAVATGIAVVVCDPGWLLPSRVVDATVSTTPFAV